MRLFGKKSREARRRFDETAWISVDGSFGVQECRVLDVSLGGAQIESKKTVPDTFVLTFSRRERRGSHCKVVWRKGHNVGVKFIA
jgi:hypothetical protein